MGQPPNIGPNGEPLVLTTPRGHDRPGDRAVREERRKLVWQGMLARMTVREIAQQLRVPKTTVHRDQQKLLKRFQDELGDDVRRQRMLDLATLNRAIQALHADVGTGDIEAIRELRGLVRERSHLLGTRAPKQHMHTGPKGGPIQVHKLSDAELEEALRSFEQPPPREVDLTDADFEDEDEDGDGDDD